MERKF